MNSVGHGGGIGVSDAEGRSVYFLLAFARLQILLLLAVLEYVDSYLLEIELLQVII